MHSHHTVDLAINETSASNTNGLLTFRCTATGKPGIQFRGWETALGRNASGETIVTTDKRRDDTDDAVIHTRLEITDFATCQQAGGYVCVFDTGDPSNTARSSVIDCPECKCCYLLYLLQRALL